MLYLNNKIINFNNIAQFISSNDKCRDYSLTALANILNFIKTIDFQPRGLNQTVELLVREVVGISKSECQQLLHIQNSNFQGWFCTRHKLNTVQVFLLAVCYCLVNYKDLPLIYTEQIKAKRLNDWLHAIIGNHNYQLNFIITDGDLAATRLLYDPQKGYCIAFNPFSQNLTSSIKDYSHYLNLNKLTNVNTGSSMLIRPHNRKLAYEIYNNSENHCLVINHYNINKIRERFEAEPSKYITLKEQHAQSLKLDGQGYSFNNLADNNVKLEITKLAKQSGILDRSFQPIQQLVTSNSQHLSQVTPGHGILIGVMLLINNKLPHIYAIVNSHAHVMSVVIRDIVNQVKIYFLDPNSSKLYFVFSLAKSNFSYSNTGSCDLDLFNNQYSHMIEQINKSLVGVSGSEINVPYLEYYKNQYLLLNFNYFHTSRVNLFQPVKPLILANDFFENIWCNFVKLQGKDNPQKLQWAIQLENYRLIRELCALPDNRYPQAIIDAVNQVIDQETFDVIVRANKEYIDCEDWRGYSALDYAIQFNVGYMVLTLLKYNASSEKSLYMQKMQVVLSSLL